MPAPLSGLLGRVQHTVKEFSLAQRTLAVIGVAVLVLGAVALSAWLTKPSMSPLFANLSATDASAIVDQLDSKGVSYQLTDGGSTILVPAEQVYQLRLSAAAAGLPAASDGGGYSLLDSMGMTSSEFQQQVTYQRAIEGELAKTISSIKGVTNASVHLALPKQSVFVSETADPTASVFVETAPGANLTPDQVQSIVHLVSAGIENMKPSDVAVIDAGGHVLSAVGRHALQRAPGQPGVRLRVPRRQRRPVDARHGARRRQRGGERDRRPRLRPERADHRDLLRVRPDPAADQLGVLGRGLHAAPAQTVGGVLGVDGSVTTPTANPTDGTRHLPQGVRHGEQPDQQGHRAADHGARARCAGSRSR